MNDKLPIQEVFVQMYKHTSVCPECIEEKFCQTAEDIIAKCDRPIINVHLPQTDVGPCKWCGTNGPHYCPHDVARD